MTKKMPNALRSLNDAHPTIPTNQSSLIDLLPKPCFKNPTASQPRYPATQTEYRLRKIKKNVLT